MSQGELMIRCCLLLLLVISQLNDLRIASWRLLARAIRNATSDQVRNPFSPLLH
jgi:hypothetical protein